MKPFNILFFFIFFINCSSIKKEPIVDYNIDVDNSYKYYDFETTQDKQTIVIIDKKQVSLKILRKYMQDDQIKNLNIIKDTVEIKKLHFSTKKIKAIIIASKK